MGKCKPRRWSISAIVITVILSLFLLPSGAGARYAASSSSAVQQSANKWQWTFNTGYRQDDLDWSIAGFIPPPPPPSEIDPWAWIPPQFRNKSVNIISELTWSDLDILQLEFGLERRFPSNVRLKGMLGLGLIVDGENQDSDYAGNNRTFEFSRSNNSSDSGETFDFSFGFGYEFLFFSSRFGLTPLVGFSFHGQNLTMTEGVQTVSNLNFPQPLGPFPDLDSSYDADWYGPWAGLEFIYKGYRNNIATRGFEILAGIEYHYTDFEARANWNLRGDLAHPVSFEQEADGSGIVFYGGFNYFFNSRWGLNFDGKYQKWETDAGNHRFLGSGGTTFDTRLNKVNWDSYSLMIGVTCRW